MLTRRELLRRWLVYALGGAAIASCSPTEQPRGTPTGISAAVPSTGAPANVAETPAVVSPTDTAVPATAVPASPTAVPPSPTAEPAYLVVARGNDAAALTRAAVEALGGMRRFVKPGDDVILKPNICSASYGPEYASTTNPVVVGTIVQLCREAGAARVRAMDLPFSGTAAEAYRVSGIRAAVEEAGGQMEIMSAAKYAQTPFPHGRDIKTWNVYQDVLKANVLINLPIAKVHDAAVLTLGMKNLMGVVLKRAEIHWAINQRIADLSTVIQPALNIIDGTRVLVRHGPVSGNLRDVVQANTIIATHDIVAGDAYAAQLFFKKTPEQVGYIRLGQEMGLGRYDFENLHVKEI